MPSPISSSAEIALRNSCSRWLHGHRPWRSMRESLQALIELPEANQALDLYGEGALMQALEAQVAALLGKPAGRFFHKGVACQLAALRLYCVAGPEQGSVALHPQSHIAIDEAEAFEALLGLRGLRVGGADTPITVADLQALPERPELLVLELPLRRGGFVLPSWDELLAISRWCRTHGVKLHFDGARLWEAAPHFGRSLAEIAALADSVYVSFYKGLGGLAGSMIVGSADFIAALAPWQTRLAGNVYTLYPFVLSAVAGLRDQLPRMAAYRQRAQQLAARLAAEPGWQVWPAPPQTNSFQLHLPAGPERLRAALLAFAAEQGFWLGARAVASTRLAGGAMVEIVIGDAAEGWSDGEALLAWRAAVAQAC
ncbi:beta-eliminating lyase-related protein [Paucibacter sp. APW11]|uniref:Beta-eliminating lyase-related protein n=1 Tax=Roseateles aquae TaxID=3077235 RepID=A0ABU3PEU9_9BURK|nr:beta-eliminating lyase-related protein [Paucibacter sp. APW11]MDT9001083.1 beta-eliminating lyase-related protein [Paucibacter sp. APW11]